MIGLHCGTPEYLFSRAWEHHGCTESFTLSGTRAGGVISVATLLPFTHIVLPAGAAVWPFSGVLLARSTNGQRLLMTIFGDETYVPPPGQGQIQLQIAPGCGTFGAPFWTNWATLSLVQSTPPTTTFYSIGGTVSGLKSGNTVVLLDNGGDPLSVTCTP